MGAFLGTWCRCLPQLWQLDHRTLVARAFPNTFPKGFRETGGRPSDNRYLYKLLIYMDKSGTRDRTRTDTVFLPGDFESPASTNFATRAGTKKQVRFEAGDSAQARLQIQ